MIEVCSKTFLLAIMLVFFSNWKPTHSQDAVAEESTAAFRSAADYSRAAKGVAVLVMKRGEIVFEDYAPGWDSKPHLLASGTKSFSGVMAVCAVEDGHLQLDEKVSDTIVEWKSDPKKVALTIRELLSLSSGIAGGDNGKVPTYATAVKEANSVAKPGEKFLYGPIPYQCFGELMRRKLEAKNSQDSVEAYLKRRVLEPIGLEVGFWRKDADGNINLPSGAFLTAREWAKFGELVRLKGKWKGKQLVESELLADCFKPARANAHYGMTFWLLNGNADTSESEGENPKARARFPQKQESKQTITASSDIVAAMGKGKQRCYIIPTLALVVVRLGDSVGREYEDSEFLTKLLADDQLSQPTLDILSGDKANSK